MIQFIIGLLQKNYFCVLILTTKNFKMNLLEDFKKVDTFIFDVDGVMTDGGILVLENGDMARKMNTKDGYSLYLAVKKGYRFFIVSGSSKSAVENRFHHLGIHHVFFNVMDKRPFVEKLMKEHHILAEQVLFMGDDMPDLPVFEVVGVSSCPADAVVDIRKDAAYISPYKGGEGCVRDVIEKVLKLRGDWNYDNSVASQ